MTQEAFGAMVGIGQPTVSRLISDGVLAEGASGGAWLLAYCERLREQAAGRFSTGELNLGQERAALARSQREGVDIKNAVLRGQYADVTLLAEVLATASQAVAQRFDHLPGLVRKSCPDLPPQVTDAVMSVIAQARNEWVRATSELAAAAVATTDDDAGQVLIDADDEPRAD